MRPLPSFLTVTRLSLLVTALAACTAEPAKQDAPPPATTESASTTQSALAQMPAWDAARAAGIQVRRLQILSFAISGLIVGSTPLALGPSAIAAGNGGHLDELANERIEIDVTPGVRPKPRPAQR